MSKLTPCNYCILQQLKKLYPDKEVTVRKMGEHKICDLQVFVGDEPIAVWFWKLSDHCVC